MSCPCLNILLSSTHEIGKEDCVLVLGKKTEDSLNLAAELGTNGKRADLNFSGREFEPLCSLRVS